MATTPLLLGDRYEVGRLLGAGGMAEVFEGRDRLLARRVAVKVLLAQFARDPAFLVRFKREAQAAASLSHPNIVAVYDTGGGADAAGGAAGGGAAAGGPGRGGRGGGVRGAGGGARAGAGPPRHQAGECDADAGGCGEGDGLRDRAGGHERDDHPGERGGGHGAVHLAGAGAGAAGRRPQRPVLPWVLPV